MADHNYNPEPNAEEDQVCRELVVINNMVRRCALTEAQHLLPAPSREELEKAMDRAAAEYKELDEIYERLRNLSRKLREGSENREAVEEAENHVNDARLALMDSLRKVFIELTNHGRPNPYE